MCALSKQKCRKFFLPVSFLDKVIENSRIMIRYEILIWIPDDMNTYGFISSFPKDEHMRSEWMKICRFKAYTTDMRICDRHFDREYWKPGKLPRLHKNTVPKTNVNKDETRSMLKLVMQWKYVSVGSCMYWRKDRI